MPKLLIVDDEMDVREFAKNFFRKRNIEVLVASNGQEALEIIESRAKRVVGMDVGLEGSQVGEARVERRALVSRIDERVSQTARDLKQGR